MEWVALAFLLAYFPIWKQLARVAVSMKTPQMNPNSHRGFTLVELLVVIAIIAVLAVITTAAAQYALAKAAGASSNLVQDAVSAGFLPAADSFGQESVDVLSALVELQRSGIEPRHLSTLRTAAEREFSLIERALTAVQKKNDVATRARAHSRANELTTHMDVVRAFLLRAVISKNLS